MATAFVGKFEFRLPIEDIKPLIKSSMGLPKDLSDQIVFSDCKVVEGKLVGTIDISFNV